MKNSHLLGSIQVFISVVDSGSFSESARRLGLSQPSVSRQINLLEEHLGVRLLQRTTRRLSMTEAGQIYYEKANQIQRHVIDASLSISGFKDKPSGVLRISSPYTWTENKIAPHLGDFLQKYPHIKLDIECNDRFQNIIEDRLDLVIRVGVLKDSSCVAVPLADINLVMCATPAYLKKFGAPKTATDLQNHNCILFETFDKLSLTKESITQEITLSGNVVANTVPVMLSIALQDIGITILPDLLINHLIQSGELVDVMPNTKIEIHKLPISQIFALYSNRKHLPAKARAFLDFFRSRF